MYAFDEVAAAAPEFRAAVRSAEAFRPLSVKLKLVDGCNLRCAMCDHWRRERKEKLSLERLRGLFAELAALGGRKVHLTGGEPGLRNDLEEIVAAGTAAGLRVTMTTNATLFTRERARRLIEAGLRAAAVSIDSPDGSVHDRQRGLAGSFEKAIAGLKNLRKESRRGKLNLAINTVVTRLNWHTLGGLPKLALRVGARAVRLMPVDDHSGEALALDADEVAQWNARIAPGLADEGVRLGLFADASEAWPFGRTPEEAARALRGDYALGHYETKPCLAPFTHALVDHDGRVFVCCMGRGLRPLGDVTQSSFEQIWCGPAYGDVRRQILTPARLPPCARCDDFLDENARLHTILETAPQPAPAVPESRRP